MRVLDCRSVIGPDYGSTPAGVGLPEVAFMGRSNVGKSSLINKLLGRNLARVSRTPGRTQRACFYNVNGAALLVDLPGYGYARAPAKVRAGLVEVLEAYLTAPRPLALAVLIVDSRHDPSSLDLKMNSWLEERGLPVQVVSTKVDKLSRQQRLASLSRSRNTLGREGIIPFSSSTGEGKRELWQAIDSQIKSLMNRTPAPPSDGPPR